MSLQGSFKTIALHDVMTLLASGNKSGELYVVGGHVEGRLWLDDGHLVASRVGKTRDHVDAVFELLRLDEGNFVFKDGAEAPEPGEPVAVEPLMAEAEQRLAQWEDIERVVPSLDHRVRLIPELPTPEITLSNEDWRLVMAVALAGTVRGVIEEAGLGMFNGTRGVSRLVEAGLVVIESPRVRPSSVDGSRAARRARASSPVATPSPDPFELDRPLAVETRPEPVERMSALKALLPRYALAVPEEEVPAGGLDRSEAMSLVHALEPADEGHPAPYEFGPGLEFPAALDVPYFELTSHDDDDDGDYGDGDGGDVAYLIPGGDEDAEAPDSQLDRPALRNWPTVSSQSLRSLESAESDDELGADDSVESSSDAETPRPPKPTQVDNINRGLLLKFLSSVRS